MTEQDKLKRLAAKAAVMALPSDCFLGVGTGSTVNHFIDELKSQQISLRGAVPSSDATEARLRDAGIPIATLADGNPEIYVDGADLYNSQGQLIKGGGGALTREKVIATASRQFICIVDESKYSEDLNRFPLPVEVLAMARSYVAREFVKMGGDPVYREGFFTDNGHCILDIHRLGIDKPIAWDQKLNQIPGIVTHGLFALRPADHLIVGKSTGIEEIRP